MNQFQLFAQLRRTVAPTSEIFTLETVENYLRITSDGGGPIDDDVTAFITFAREQLENILGRAFLYQTWQLNLRNWPGRDYQNWPTNTPSDFESYQKYNFIELPRAAPLAGFFESPPAGAQVAVTYLDTSANSSVMPQGNTAGGYNIDPNFEPARLFLPFSQIWPTTILLPGAAITIVYRCGYPDVPTWQSNFEGANAVIMAMKQICGYVYENRIPPSEMRKAFVASGINYVVEEILATHRIYH